MLIVEGWGKSLWDILSLCDNLSLTLYINIKKRYQGILHSNTHTCLPIWVFDEWFYQYNICKNCTSMNISFEGSGIYDIEQIWNHSIYNCIKYHY